MIFNDLDHQTYGDEDVLILDTNDDVHGISPTKHVI